MDRQAQARDAAAVALAVLERQRAAVRLGDLPRQHEPDARAARLRREERHEEVRRVRQPRPVVGDPDLEPGRRRASSRAATPPCVSSAASGGVAHEVDEELLELVGVGRRTSGGARDDADGQPRLEARDAAHERVDGDGRRAAAAAGARASRRRS